MVVARDGLFRAVLLLTTPLHPLKTNVGGEGHDVGRRVGRSSGRCRGSGRGRHRGERDSGDSGDSRGSARGLALSGGRGDQSSRRSLNGRSQVMQSTREDSCSPWPLALTSQAVKRALQRLVFCPPGLMVAVVLGAAITNRHVSASMKIC